MFQANYQYTPLKEYAAMKSNQTTNNNSTNGTFQSKYIFKIFPQPNKKKIKKKL